MITCRIATLPSELTLIAAAVAVGQSPTNAPLTSTLTEQLALLFGDPQHLAVLTSRYWGPKGVSLGVSFLDSPDSETRTKILAAMNEWNATANVRFAWSASGGQVRITRSEDGYWSYLGTDILSVGRNEPTMCLEGFTASTSDAEYKRVVTHETGHTLGFPHEHLRSAIVQRLDVQKTLTYFMASQGWSEAVVRANVLTPLEESSIMGTPGADETSIMSYALPGSITVDGRPILGGVVLSPQDLSFAARLYPQPRPLTPTLTIDGPLAAGSYRLTPT